MAKIAILYTTFMRDDLMVKSLQSIVSNYTKDYILLVGDQNPTEDKINMVSNEQSFYYGLPFDCGLSYARNYLAQEASRLGCDYCLLTADSIILNKTLFDKLPKIIEFLSAQPERGLVGFDINNRVKWEFNLALDNAFVVNLANDTLEENGIKYKKCDICRNFFLVKTEVLIKNKWDDELKLCEHEDWFWRLKKETNYQVFFTYYIAVDYINDRNTEYNKYRGRAYSEFQEKLLKKYNMKRWIKYGEGVGFS
jgi:GT2 family glycosyltransferase